MPELPEVESARLQLERILRGKRLARVYVDTKDHIVFDKQSPQAVKRALVDAKVLRVCRKGKYLWLELDRRPWPVLHLGMSGHVEVRNSDGAWERAKRRQKPPAKGTPDDHTPPYCRLMLTTTEGIEIAMTDPRRFGRIRLAKDPATEAPIALLGADPLENFPAPAALRKLIEKKRSPIKSVLLDQSVFAGVGNWIADEILFQARISPHRLASELSPAEVKRIHARTLSIIRKAVKVNANYDRFPENWLFHDRWGKRKDAYNSRGYEIRHDTIGGRTSAWVPALQS